MIPNHAGEKIGLCLGQFFKGNLSGLSTCIKYGFHLNPSYYLLYTASYQV